MTNFGSFSLVRRIWPPVFAVLRDQELQDKLNQSLGMAKFLPPVIDVPSGRRVTVENRFTTGKIEKNWQNRNLGWEGLVQY